MNTADCCLLTGDFCFIGPNWINRAAFNFLFLSDGSIILAPDSFLAIVWFAYKQVSATPGKSKYRGRCINAPAVVNQLIN